MTPTTRHPAPLLIRDWRCPGSRMTGASIKFPGDLLERLQIRADRLGCSRAALARDLVALGIEQLEAAAAAAGEVA